ncbi:hypothetical protein [Dactylosporangium sp. CS-033363]|uniref:hypothetical protein n=1 Tax=Dactylosporangium sp. CS-033363 TaxID=3239935 RepID=UPI003D95046E
MSMATSAIRMVTAGCAAVTLALGLAGCSGDDGATADRDATYTTAALKAGVLEPADVGTSWKRPEQQPPTTTLTPLCPGVPTRPPIPGTPGVIAAALADEGDKGAQAFDQMGLAYADAPAMEAAFTKLQDAMEACPPSATRSAGPREESSEAGYTETSTIEPLESGGWKGFVTLRHKVYEPTYPGSADIAVAVVGRGNAVVVASYAVYWVGEHSTGPEFDTDWRRMVGTVLSRTDAKRAK